MSLNRTACALVSIVALTACTALPSVHPGPRPPPVGDPGPPDPSERAADREPLRVPAAQSPSQAAPEGGSLPAVVRMHQLAEAAGGRGEHRRAIALLERALRIAPRDPETYYQLARRYLFAGEPARGLQMAERGLSLAPAGELRGRLEWVREDCRRALSA